jgi:ATP-dependent protease ClpP protease subunit
MKKLAALLVTSSLAFGTLAFSAGIDWSKEKVIPIVGEVNVGILQQAQELEKQAGRPVIRIFINSPGGSVMAGNVFIQAMEVAKARGSRIDCAVSNLAASMGMHVFAHCDNRYILTGGYLLFHEPRVGIQSPVSPSEATTVRAGLLAATQELSLYLQKQLGVSDDVYNFHNIGQTLWSAASFKANIPEFRLTVVNDIRLPKGIPSAFDPIGSPSFGLPLADTTSNPITYPGPIVN